MSTITVQKRNGTKVAIIGVGRIGTNVAFQVYDKLGRKGSVDKIILVGRDLKKISCIAEEITHANDGSITTHIEPTTDIRSAVGCDVVVY
jgi:malate/lactate dehydrogenase